MLAKIATTVILLSMGFPLPVDAHDIYSDVVDAAGRSCCDRTDCQPASYRVTGTGLRMDVYGVWVEVPRDTIQYRTLAGDTGETNGGHWCGTGHHPYLGPEDHVTRCAILPPEAASAGGAASAWQPASFRP